MAGLFYQGGRDNNKQDHHHHHQDKDHNEDRNNNYLHLYKDEIYNNNKGFEIWPPQYFQQQQEQQNHVASPTTFYSFGMVPSGSSHNNNRSSNRSLYFNVVSDHEPVRSSSGRFTVTRQGSMNCQDCGNQAKKDCPHMRCRTCCKSRGFDCQTHVKSTWVPAAKRRERQAQLAGLTTKRSREASSGGGEDDDGREGDENGGQGGGGGSALACIRVVNASSSGFESSHLPPEVSSPAVFRCMRVSSIDDEDEEYAYQTAVSIGGHVFKGILYDQGPSDVHRYSSSPAAVAAETSQHHLNFLAAASSVATTTAVAASNIGNASIDPSSLYTAAAAAAPINSFITASTPFFASPRS